MLELTAVARSSGISFESITPQGSTVISDYQVVPITVVFDGNFFQLNDFLFRLRNLVDVRQGALAADGRLYFTSEQGEVRVVRAGPAFELLAVNDMADVCMATPAISAGMLFVRSQHFLFALGRKPGEK